MEKICEVKIERSNIYKLNKEELMKEFVNLDTELLRLEVLKERILKQLNRLEEEEND